MITSYIEVTVPFLGTHHWRDAPKNRQYLRYPHQHIFDVTVRMSVGDLDRQVEFHDLRELVASHLEDYKKIDSAWSCEMYAKDLYTKLKIKYDNDISVVVGEGDGVKGKYGDIVG